jgi:hypothetical protein
MTSIYEMFATNETDAEDGKWFDFGPTMKVRIRRFKSKKSRKVREALEAPYKRVTKFGTTLPDDVQEDIATEHIATGIVVDWRGVTDRDGAEISYSKAAAIKLFTEIPEFRDAVAEISLSLDNYRDEEKEDVLGN